MPHNTKQQQKEFIDSQIVKLTLGATLGRNKTYSSNVSTQRRADFKKSVEDKLKSLSKDYIDGRVSEVKHEGNIKRFAENISKEYEDCLLEGGFRIGTAQKALNLFLKYLWCLGKIKEPPHFPMDSIILPKIPGCSGIRWTQLDSIDEYREIVKKAKVQAKAIDKECTLAKWELYTYNNRNQ